MAKGNEKDEKADEKDKAAKKAKKGKKGKGKKGAGGPSVATHPRAAASIRRAKGFGGLAGFALAALLSHRAGLSAPQVLERALVTGVGGYVLAWACAVAVWRSLVLAEVRAIIERREQLQAARPAIPLVGSAAPPEPRPAEIQAAATAATE